MQEKRYEIWAEGYMTIHDHNIAICCGSVIAKTFEEACNKLAQEKPLFGNFFDSQNMTHWGCKLYDNEKDARKSFG